MSAASIVAPTAAGIRRAADLVRASHPIAVPTETVYGLAAAASDAAALERVFAAKGRPHSDPLIIHVSPGLLRAAGGRDPLEALERLRLVRGDSLPPPARASLIRLLEEHWPGPLTVVLPRGPAVADLATAGLSTVALRMPRHQVAQALIDAVGAPLAAPSANRFGRVSPTCAADVAEELGDRIPLILDGGRTEIGIESTVLQAETDGTLRLLRPGAVTRDEIERLTGTVVAEPSTRSAPAGPGMLPVHYAPATPLRLLRRPVAELPEAEIRAATGELGEARPIGLLLMAGPPEPAARVLAGRIGREVVARSLSPNRTPAEAGRNLFACLRALDHAGAAVLLAEPCPESTGLWEAIADRLRRAAASSAPYPAPSDSRR